MRYLQYLVFLYAISSTLYAQCVGPYCSPSSGGNYGYSSPSYNYPPSGRYSPSTPQLPAEDADIPAALQEAIRNASVIVEYTISASGTARQNSRGSGTLVRWGDRLMVFTAGHAVRSSSQMYIIHGDKRIPATVLYDDDAIDIAALEPTENQEELYQKGLITITGAPDLSNRVVYLAGFAHGQQFRIRKARVLQIHRQNGGEWILLNRPSLPGDSGGGVFTEDGKLVAVIWGTYYSYTYSTWIAPVAVAASQNSLPWRWRFFRRNPDNDNRGGLFGCLPQNRRDNRGSGNPGGSGTPGQDVPDVPDSTPPDKPDSDSPPDNPGGDTPPDNPAVDNQVPSQPPQTEPKPEAPAVQWWEPMLYNSLYVVIGFLAFLISFLLMYLLWLISRVRIN